MATQMRDTESAKPKSGIQNWGKPKHEIDRSTLSTAELAECTCPEFCERDHDND